MNLMVGISKKTMRRKLTYMKAPLSHPKPRPASPSEVHSIIGKLKGRSAAGADTISNNILKVTDDFHEYWRIHIISQKTSLLEIIQRRLPPKNPISIHEQAFCELTKSDIEG